MKKKTRSVSKRSIAAAIGACALFGGIAATLWSTGHSELAHAQVVTTAPAAPKSPTSEPSADQAIERGHYIAITADCVACHTAPHSRQPFAGGYALQTPFGKLLSSNITSDRETGIGDWTEAEFERAVREGKGKHGENLYPAMPYNAYAKMSDQDVSDLWAYIRTIKPVHQQVESNQLPFPFNIRLMMTGWNLFFFDNAHFTADPTKSVEWNRGAYLVQGAAHCAACHTPKNFLGGDIASEYLQGGVLPGWFAPEITNDARLGLGSWSEADVVQYLKIGSNRLAVAGGPMAEAVTNSTQHMTDADLHSIAVYLKSVKGSNQPRPAPLAQTEPIMLRGKQVFEANCAACHNSHGTGVTTMVTGFANNPSIQASHVDTLVRVVLEGNRGAVTAGNPTGAGMPAFSWKLSDDDVAAALTYTRNSWGNAAASVTADTVGKIRANLKPQPRLNYAP